jgi:hypothetical protein
VIILSPDQWGFSMINFRPDVILAAQRAFTVWGIPASVSLAQYFIESGNGEHMPPGSNNPFGIKAVGDQPSVMANTWEVTKDGRRIREVQPFRKFASIDEAFDRHAKLLATAKPYEDARRTLPNAVEFAKAIGPRYATDPDYGETISKIIIDHSLIAYDIPVPASAATPIANAKAATTPKALPKPNPVVFAGVAAAPVAAATGLSKLLDGWMATVVPAVLPVIVIVAVLLVWQHIRNHQAKVAQE